MLTLNQKSKTKLHVYTREGDIYSVCARAKPRYMHNGECAHTRSSSCARMISLRAAAKATAFTNYVFMMFIYSLRIKFVWPCGSAQCCAEFIKSLPLCACVSSGFLNVYLFIRARKKKNRSTIKLKCVCVLR